MRIFLSAGEASGDAYAAALVEALRADDLTFEGVGGNRLRAAIGELVADSSTWGAISIVQSLGVAPRAVKGAIKARRQLKKGRPGLLIAIDFGFFNIRLCRWAKKAGWKVLYFMPPSSWRRDRQGKDLPAITDAVVTPFPWSAEILRANGANAHFFGHPLRQLIGERRSEVERVEGQIAVLAGSRSHELERNLPMIADFAKSSPGGWKSAHSGGAMRDTITPAQSAIENRLEFAVSPNIDLEHFRSTWESLAPGRADVFTQNDTYGVLGRADAAIVCSGTATLEAALMRCPHVVVYRVTPAMAREAKLIGFKMPKYISLPNIVLDRELVPELVGLEIHPSSIRAKLEPLLKPGIERQAQIKGFQEIEEILGPPTAISMTANLVREMITFG
jgi:lipid-A-disaccharide synthase